MIVEEFTENGIRKRIEEFRVTKLIPCLAAGSYICDESGAGVISQAEFKNKRVRVGDLVRFTNIKNGSGYWSQMFEDVYLNSEKI